jgi:transcriptional regulator with XRE-family HTH domain
MAVLAAGTLGVGPLLRTWRKRRHLSQLELSLDSAVSARHLSFIETGRARPSREMLLHLAEQLEIPLRERNGLLLAAGFAPLYGERPLESAEMAPVREALNSFLEAHEPYPAVVVDRHWHLVAGNRAISVLTEGVAPELLEPPANAMRLTLHPDGMAPRIVNLAQWSAHLLERLRRQVAVTGDEELDRLRRELEGYPGVSDEPPVGGALDTEIVLPLRLNSPAGELSFFATVTTFGTAVDVTLAELSIEAFYPADGDTAEALRRDRERRP